MLLRKDLLVRAYESLREAFAENDDCFSAHALTDDDDTFLLNLNFLDDWCTDRLVRLRIYPRLCHVALTLHFDESRTNDLLDLMTEWGKDDMFDATFHKKGSFYIASVDAAPHQFLSSSEA